jgi:hypothetical protein
VYFYHPSPFVNTASFRLRCYYPALALNHLGVNTQYGNSLDDASKSNTVIFSKAYSEEILEFIKNYNGRVIFDLCDNHFIKSISHKKLLIKMCNSVDRITTSTQQLSLIIESYSNCTPRIIEDTLDYWIIKQNYDVDITKLAGVIKSNSKKKNKSGFSLWFGNSGSKFSTYGGVSDIQIFKKYINPFKLYVVTNGFIKTALLFMCRIFPIYSKFSVSNLHKKISKSGQIIIPIRKNNFTIIKSENRLLTSVALGVDIIYTQIPSYRFLEQYSTLLSNDVYRFKTKDVTTLELIKILQPFSYLEIGKKWIIQIIKP